MALLNNEVYFLENAYFYKLNLENNTVTQCSNKGSKPYDSGTKQYFYPLKGKLYLIQHEPWGYGSYYYYSYDPKSGNWTEMNTPSYPYPSDGNIYFIKNNICYLLHTDKYSSGDKFELYKTSNGSTFTKIEKNENNMNVYSVFPYKNEIYSIDNNSLYKFNFNKEIFEKVKGLNNYNITNSPQFFYIGNEHLYVKKENSIVANETYYKKIK